MDNKCSTYSHSGRSYFISVDEDRVPWVNINRTGEKITATPYRKFILEGGTAKRRWVLPVGGGGYLPLREDCGPILRDWLLSRTALRVTADDFACPYCRAVKCYDGENPPCVGCETRAEYLEERNREMEEEGV